MKKRNRFAAIALAALLLAGSAPSALALDATPPMYEQFGYDSTDEFMQKEGWLYSKLDYAAVSDFYRRYLDSIHQNPQIALELYDYSSLAELDDEIADGRWENREECYRNAAMSLVFNNEWIVREEPSVQLDGVTIVFSDAEPEKVNGRVMVPFRAIAEAMGAKVDYNAGQVTASKDGQTLSFTLGSKEVRVLDSTGQLVNTIGFDAALYKKNGRTYVPVRLFGEGFGLTVQWDEDARTVVMYDRDALVEQINNNFTILNKWIQSQSLQTSTEPLHSALTLNGIYTEFDTINGNKDYQVNATIDLLSDGKRTEVNAAADLRVLVQFLLGEHEPTNAAELATTAALNAALKNVTVDIICNADSSDIYLRCPVLAKLLLSDIEDPETNYPELAQMANGGWLHADWSDLWFTSGIQSGLSDLRQLQQIRSVGESIVSARESEIRSDDWYDWFSFYGLVQEDRTSLEQFAADDLFTQNGTRYTAKLNIHTEYDGTTTGSYTLNTANGSISGSIEQLSNDSDSKTSLTFSGTLPNCKMKFSYHMKNMGEITLDLALHSEASKNAPKTAPEEGSTIVEWISEGASE